MDPSHNLCPGSDQPSYYSNPTVVTSGQEASKFIHNKDQPEDERDPQSQEIHHMTESAGYRDIDLRPDTGSPTRAANSENTSQATHPKELFGQHLNDPMRIKKNRRTQFTVYQLEKLEATFSQSQYISTPRRRSLSQQLCLSEESVKNWFKNRRAKWRREQCQYLRPSSFAPVPCFQYHEYFGHGPFSHDDMTMVYLPEYFAEHDQHMRLNNYR